MDDNESLLMCKYSVKGKIVSCEVSLKLSQEIIFGAEKILCVANVNDSLGDDVEEILI